MHSATKTVGYGYVAKWNDGSLGRILPDYVHGCNGLADRVTLRGRTYICTGDRSYLCRITIEQVFDSRGRPIVRFMRKRGADAP